jgi:hypothetical protein
MFRWNEDTTIDPTAEDQLLPNGYIEGEPIEMEDWNEWMRRERGVQPPIQQPPHGVGFEMWDGQQVLAVPPHTSTYYIRRFIEYIHADNQHQHQRDLIDTPRQEQLDTIRQLLPTNNLGRNVEQLRERIMYHEDAVWLNDISYWDFSIPRYGGINIGAPDTLRQLGRDIRDWGRLMRQYGCSMENVKATIRTSVARACRHKVFIRFVVG